jgi:hypothetical protein
VPTTAGVWVCGLEHDSHADTERRLLFGSDIRRVVEEEPVGVDLGTTATSASLSHTMALSKPLTPWRG